MSDFLKVFEIAAHGSGGGATSADASCVRHRPAVGENAADQIDHFRRRSFREVSEYSTAGPELAREAACSRRRSKWHRLKTGRDQIPH